MDTKTITAELNEEQYKKYQIMQENNLSVGEAIDLIFTLREEFELQANDYLEERLAELNDKKESLSKEMSSIDDELNVLKKIVDSPMDFKQKRDIIEKEYASFDETYDIKVLSAKHQVSWVTDFFKF